MTSGNAAGSGRVGKGRLRSSRQSGRQSGRSGHQEHGGHQELTEFSARIAASRPARAQRAVLLIVGLLSLLALLLSGGGWLASRYIGDQFLRVAAGTTGTPSSGPLNILLAGVDVRSGLTARQRAQLHVGSVPSQNSDTLMLIHVFGDHRHVEVVSLPRDSWVAIPGSGMNKINAAIGIGGPSLAVRTVEQATGLTINDFIQVDFLGFVKLIDELGGVDICLPFAVSDSYSGLRLSAGRHHVNGVTALEFARDRHSFATSDLSRIFDQQQLIATIASQAIRSGTLSNPARISRLLSAVTSMVKIDQGLNVVELASELRNIRAAGITFETVPLSDVNYTTPTGLSAVLWDSPAAAALFARIGADQLPQRPHRAPRSSSSPSGSGSAAPPRTAARAACR